MLTEFLDLWDIMGGNFNPGGVFMFNNNLYVYYIVMISIMYILDII